ncbi:transposase [Paenibacillus sp. GD4]|uniref:transposase n=1 Tax=Paenibacillus sp. GD4 TaxID=3068890 RepID=UPI0027969FBD|nr:transposase [Paenibacillus sp. GD4]MDQ1914317.1 transposase [Paenibacillus sp. GD4]
MRLDTIPGIGRRTAEQILSEVGTDVGSRFPTATHLCSWQGSFPGRMKVPVNMPKMPLDVPMSHKSR